MGSAQDASAWRRSYRVLGQLAPNEIENELEKSKNCAGLLEPALLCEYQIHTRLLFNIGHEASLGGQILILITLPRPVDLIPKIFG